MTNIHLFSNLLIKAIQVGQDHTNFLYIIIYDKHTFIFKSTCLGKTSSARAYKFSLALHNAQQNTNLVK